MINLCGGWKFHIGDNRVWASPTYDDSDWDKIQVPSAWEDEGFNGYDGFAWYRIKFDGRKLRRDQVYYLNAGFIDDADEAYLNGKFVGFSGWLPPKFKTAYNSERRYTLPAEVINFEGDNVLAIRVFDAMQGGGIVDGAIGIYPVTEEQKLLINLQGLWSFAKSDNEDRVSHADDWESIMVPGMWEHQGYKYDGFAWCKRTFTLPANFTKETLVLLAGRIDDFDKVYLNGTLIGNTNDHRNFGRSGSYQELRAYAIPPLLLKRTGSNLIEILVEDMGHNGGIYEGPIGITTRANFDKYFKER